jgi:predicted Ser/Thr protein kinase
MKENKLSRSPTQAIADDVEWKILTTEMTNFYRKHLYQDAQGVHTQLRNTLWFLEWKGLQHLDIRYNPWNIMVDNTGNLYIIDFWKTNITERIRKELEVKKNLQKHP